MGWTTRLPRSPVTAMSESDFDNLRKHLEPEARPVFEAFLQKHGLEVPDHLGRYPRLRGEHLRADGILASVDFVMEFDEHGQYFTTFCDDLPYELSGGLAIDRDEPEGRVRYAKFAVTYGQKPFGTAVRTLARDLEGLWATIERWSMDDVLSGRRKVIEKTRG